MGYSALNYVTSFAHPDDYNADVQDFQIVFSLSVVMQVNDFADQMCGPELYVMHYSDLQSLKG